jgi:ferric-dicitrate binding protein FerR (iron transport regulator)
MHLSNMKGRPMSDSQQRHDAEVDRLSKATEPTGRQDIISPDVTTEQSDPTPVDMKRGARVWLGFMLVGGLFVAIIIYFIATS